MRFIEILKGKNRTLLEMYLGILFYGAVCQIIGALLVKDQWMYAKSLWFGIVLAMVSTLHMYRTLNRALDSELNASKLAVQGYLIRYVSIMVILGIVMVTKVMNPLVVFLAYMSLKVTALLQPITHKVCNKVLKET